ncbi:MAG: hypothetical protein KC609_08425 [Myxococcales bacterium]|nr:hypothetical protein [Myxococcales bacterium]
MKRTPWLTLLVGLLLATGCGVPATSGEKLRTSVLHYNESYRWGKYYTASLHLELKKRKAFLESTIDSKVRVTEYDIREVIHNSAKKEAYVIVRYNWYALPSLRVHTSTYRQHWKYKDTAWLLVDQMQLKRKKKKRVSLR